MRIFAKCAGRKSEICWYSATAFRCCISAGNTACVTGRPFTAARQTRSRPSTPLKFLIDKMREEQIPVVYALELSSQRVAEAIAETTGARVVTFYSCQTVSAADWAAGEGYLSLMRRNVAALREDMLNG